MGPSPLCRIGIDLGGTKIEAIALESPGGVIERRRVATPRGDYAATVRAVRDLVRAVETAVGRGGSVGVGIPGTISQASGRVKNANATWLNGRPFDRDLEAALERPIRTANDADCFALSEASDGAAAGARSVFGVILGTGVGGGIVIDGRLLAGCNGIAGEWGHNPLPWPRDDERPGPSCYCGKQGCIEVFLSGPGLARDYRAGNGADIDPKTIGALAASGDDVARAMLERYSDRLARGLATVINVLDPEVIVLGGGLSQLPSLCGAVESRLARYVFSDRVETRLTTPRHGDSSGVRGAAWLWREHELAHGSGVGGANP